MDIELKISFQAMCIDKPHISICMADRDHNSYSIVTII